MTIKNMECSTQKIEISYKDSIEKKIMESLTEYTGETLHDDVTELFSHFCGYDIVNTIDYAQLVSNFPGIPLPIQDKKIIILFQIDPLNYLLREPRVMEAPSWRDTILVTDFILFVSSFYNAPIPKSICINKLYNNAKYLIEHGVVMRGSAMLSDANSLLDKNIIYGDLVADCLFDGVHKVANGIYSVSLKIKE